MQRNCRKCSLQIFFLHLCVSFDSGFVNVFIAPKTEFGNNVRRQQPFDLPYIVYVYQSDGSFRWIFADKISYNYHFHHSSIDCCRCCFITKSWFQWSNVTRLKFCLTSHKKKCRSFSLIRFIFFFSQNKHIDRNVLYFYIETRIQCLLPFAQIRFYFLFVFDFVLIFLNERFNSVHWTKCFTRWVFFIQK